MHPDKWPEIKEKIKNSFEVLDERTEEDPERRENLEIVEFMSPLGKVKLEWITRPKVLDTKTHYSNRIGSDIGVEVVYSEDEVTHTLKVYQWNEGRDEFIEVEADKFNF